MFVERIFKNRIHLLALLTFLAITCITFFKSALELEDAEQAYYSQWLRWGYDDQPPLYTWMQYFVNQVFGVQKISFSILRATIFASILLAISHIASKILSNQKKSELAVLLLVLLPVFIDFTFRRLSHTSLLCLSIIITIIIIKRLLREKTWVNYSLLGLVLSIGILSKYNYILFLVALGCAVFFDTSIRNIVFDRKFLLSVLLMILFLSPHLNWLLGHEGYVLELRQSIAIKTENNLDTKLYVIGPLFSLIVTVFKLIAPLLVVFILAFAFGKLKFQRPKFDWFTKLALIQFLVIILLFVFMNIQKVEERWLLPLVLPFMIVLLRSVEFNAIQKWYSYLFVVFVSVIVIQTLRTPVERILNIPSSVHFGFEPLSGTLNSQFGEQIWMLPDVTYGGNIKMLNPKKEIFSKDDFSLPPINSSDANIIEVVIGKQTVKEEHPLGRLLDFGKERDTLFIVPYELGGFNSKK